METAEMPSVLDVLDVLDEIEAELAKSAAAGGQVAVNAERMQALTARLRAAVVEARAHPADEALRSSTITQAEAQGALLREEARRKAELLLDGTRVRQLREEHVQSIIGESRRRGERLVAEAYAYSREHMQAVIIRAEEARRHVALAREAVRTETPGVGRRLTGAAKQLATRRGGLLSSMISRFFPS